MAQPPDGRRPMPWEPSEPVPPPEAPTVAWTPPDAAPDPATPPDDATPLPEPLTPPDPGATPEEPASPLISWSPSGGTASPTPGSPATGDQAPVVGWTVPTDQRQASPIPGYVIAGMPSRVVGYFIDSVLFAILSIIVVAIADPTAYDPRAPLPRTMSPPLLLGQLIVLGIEFAYFVGFWTSRGRATIGMRLVRIEVVGARGDRPLTLVPAAARWLLLSGAIGLIGFLPLAPEVGSFASLIWVIVLFVSVMANPLRQGIHDQAAGSLVVQRVGVSSNAAVIGCLLLVLLFVVVPIVSLIALGSQVEEILLEVGRSI